MCIRDRYVSGSNYRDKMSDYCAQCAFQARKTCPITSMYWDFLSRHRPELSELQRMRLPLASQAKRSPAKQDHDRAVARRVMEALARGERLTPADFLPLSLARDQGVQAAG